MRVRGWVLTIAAALLLVPVEALQAAPAIRFRATGTVGGDAVTFERVERGYFTDVVSSKAAASDPAENMLSVRFGNNGAGDVFRWDIELAMPRGQVGFEVGRYEGPERSLINRSRNGGSYFSISARGTNVFSCSQFAPIQGRFFVLEELTFHEIVTTRVATAKLSFTEVCGTNSLIGTVNYSESGVFDDDGGGGDTPTVPPPPFQITLPTDFNLEPIVLGGGGSKAFDFSTAVNSGFASDLHLSVETDALEHEDFHATVTPSVIPAPGVGDAELVITTGPLTFPRVYTVRLVATANDQTFSTVFQVQVNCDPPFILGTNQPKAITAANGSQVTLEVTPSGTGPFFYQWYKGIPGMTRSPVLAANESKLIFTTRETATYWVRVSNACGSTNSTGAVVTTTGTLSGPSRRRGS